MAKRIGAVVLALLVPVALAQAQDRRGGNQEPAPTLKGTVAAYEADASLAVEKKLRGGQTEKSEFTVVKDKTRIELASGIEAIRPGLVVSIWAEKDDPKVAARIRVEPEPPAARGKVTAYVPDQSLTVETPVRGGGTRSSEFTLAKDKTRLELPAGVKALEVGMTVSVWAEKENPKAAARIAPAAPPARRGRGGEPAPKPEPAPDKPVGLQDVLDAHRAHLPTAQKLEWYTLDWVNTLGEARERAAREGRPILFIQTNKEGDLFCSLC